MTDDRAREALTDDEKATLGWSVHRLIDLYRQGRGMNSSQFREEWIAAVERILTQRAAADPEVIPDTEDGQANDCTHASATGVDTTCPRDPSKVWRCDHCGLRWTSSGAALTAATATLAAITDLATAALAERRRGCPTYGLVSAARIQAIVEEAKQ